MTSKSDMGSNLLITVGLRRCLRRMVNSQLYDPQVDFPCPLQSEDSTRSIGPCTESNPQMRKLTNILMQQCFQDGASSLCRAGPEYVVYYVPKGYAYPEGLNELLKESQEYLLPPDLRYYVTNTVYMSVTESCCTPAVLLRARKIPQIVDRLSMETMRSAADGRAKNHILDKSSFIGRQTDTNLVVHIGSMSSIRRRRIKLDEVLFVENRQNN
ncbi:hypothetical protein KIN20_020759 [Parelaphostrongylus tenuis]|uniref:Uncharacterized protein n=1 Tax=Parelaphostrongylus tenuis TaxID=148309 RepID=A0AAD5QVR5_PARTN|nr:hypothetical protein KIN20_020759 [Parelaphostrongylus tenuis]